VALLKPLFTLIQGTSPAPYGVYAPISPGIQLPDPMNFIPAHLWYNEAQVVDTNMSISLSLILMATSLFLFYRWRSYYLFCQSLSTQSSLQKEEEEFRSILTKLRKKIGVQARLFITRTEYESPFSLGVRDPLMVFPSYILAQLTPEEKEAVFTHELVHIRQRDTFWQWVPVILKDLLLFSPFIHYVFRKISLEREKRVDQVAVNYLDNSLSLFSALLKTARLMRGQKSSLPMTQSFFTQRFLRPGQALTERTKALIDSPERRKLSWGKRILIGIAIFLLLYPQFFLHIRLFSYTIQIL